MPVLKTAYDQEYLTLVFGRDHLNPMLVYDDQPLPFTSDNCIDISYLQKVYNLQPQTFGFQTWIRQVGIYNFAKTNNIEYSSSQSLDSKDFKSLDPSQKRKTLCHMARFLSSTLFNISSLVQILHEETSSTKISSSPETPEA